MDVSGLAAMLGLRKMSAIVRPFKLIDMRSMNRALDPKFPPNEFPLPRIG